MANNKFEKEYKSLIKNAHRSAVLSLKKNNDNFTFNTERLSNRFYWNGLLLKDIYRDGQRLYGNIQNGQTVEISYSHELIYISDFLENKLNKKEI